MLGVEDVADEAARVQEALSALCAALDPDSVPLSQATSLWQRFAAMERSAAGAKLRLATRVEESRSWQAKGSRSPAEHQANQSGTSTGRARSALETSKRLAGLPETDEALANGELSEDQAAAIAGAAGVDPASESRLVELARRRDLRSLREECARVRARAEDEAERAARLHRQRSLRTWTGADGSWNLSARNTPEVGAEIEAALAPLRETIFQSARRAGEHESGEAYGADALAEMARRSAGAEDARPQPAGADSPAPGSDGGGGAAGCESDPERLPAEAADMASPSPPRRPPRSRRPDTKVIVRIDYAALKRGWAEADETCEIAGVGPVSVASVKDLLGDAFGAAIVTNGVDVYTVAHLGRSVSSHQRTALEERGYGCEVPGCGATTALEIDHVEAWQATRRTKLDALAWLCKRHHAQKTHKGWRLEGPPGDRRWIPPPAAAGADPSRRRPSPMRARSTQARARSSATSRRRREHHRRRLSSGSHGWRGRAHTRDLTRPHAVKAESDWPEAELRVGLLPTSGR